MNSKLKYAILASTFFSIFYAFMPQVGFPYGIVFTAFIVANILLFRMVYIILRHGKESSGTFSDSFYEDFDTNLDK